MRSIRRWFLNSEWWIALSAGVVLTGLFLYNILQHLTTHLTSREDGILIGYIIKRVTLAIQNGEAFFNLPFLHPYSNTLAYSDPFLPTALLTLPLLWFTQNLVLIHNLHLVFGTLFLFVGWYVLSKQLDRSSWVALIVATWGTFAPFHFHYVVHLHTYLLAGIPWCLIGILQWKRSGHLSWAVVALLAFWYQVFNAPMTGFFLSAILGCLVFSPSLRHLFWRNKLKIGAAIGLTAFLAILLYQPYFTVSKEFNYTRTIRDTAHFASSLNRWWQLDFVIIGLIGMLAFIRKQTRHQLTEIPTSVRIVLLLVGAVLLLGPALKLNEVTFKLFGLPIPLPYAVAYYLVPGWQAFRDSSRWIVVAGVGQTLLLSGWLVQAHIKRWQLVGLFVAISSFLWLTQFPALQVFPIPQSLPERYSLLPPNDQVVAEFPVMYWRMMPYSYLENDRLLYQLEHQHPIYNGVSGFTPPAREKEIDELWREFPQPSSLEKLKQAGVELVLIDFEMYETLAENNFEYMGIPTLTQHKLKAQLVTTNLTQLSCTATACLYTIADK